MILRAVLSSTWPTLLLLDLLQTTVARMANIFLQEWAVTILEEFHGRHYKLLSASAMDMLFEDLCQELPEAADTRADAELYTRVVDAALVRAAKKGWRFCSVPPWYSAEEAMGHRYAQWVLKRGGTPARHLTLPADALTKVLAFVVTHRHVRSIAHRRPVYAVWTPRFHYKLELAQRKDGQIIQRVAPFTCSEVQCKCCRAHNCEDWPSGCKHCLEGWVLSCVSKCWWANLKALAARMKVETYLKEMSSEAFVCKAFTGISLDFQ